MAVATCVATAFERRRALPVDAMIPDALFTSTHAITIDAPPMQRKQRMDIARRAELTMSRSSAFKTADRQAARER
jgi:hypothetical protein